MATLNERTSKTGTVTYKVKWTQRPRISGAATRCAADRDDSEHVARAISARRRGSGRLLAVLDVLWGYR